MISEGSKHQEETEKEQERERDTFFRVAHARELFSFYLVLNCTESEREREIERAKAGSFELNVKYIVKLSWTFFIVAPNSLMANININYPFYS
jgi:hypothetical protein